MNCDGRNNPSHGVPKPSDNHIRCLNWGRMVHLTWQDIHMENPIETGVETVKDDRILALWIKHVCFTNINWIIDRYCWKNEVCGS